MNNSLQIFENAEFGEIRSVMIDGEPWFVGKDVATALGYERTADAIEYHVDAEDKGVGKIPTPGGKQNMVIINESGLYSLIMGSKLPSAKRFKRWVTSEVLPALCKTKSQELQKPTESEQEAQKNTSKGEKTQMETKMQICGSEITVKEYNGERVVTLADVDAVHQRVQGTARRNFNENRDKLVEGVDYYKITPYEFRTAIGEMDIRQQNEITLLTESGYLMLVKSLRDDLAWMVQRELVNGYFKLRRVAEAVKQAEEPEDEFDTVCRALQIVDKRAKQLEARNTVLENHNEALERKIEFDAPKVKAAETFLSCKGTIDVGAFAKSIGVHPYILFRWMREDGWLMYTEIDGRPYNIPQQTAIEKGLMTVKYKRFGGDNDDEYLSVQARVTPKGAVYFREVYGDCETDELMEV